MYIYIYIYNDKSYKINLKYFFLYCNKENFRTSAIKDSSQSPFLEDIFLSRKPTVNVEPCYIYIDIFRKYLMKQYRTRPRQ